MLQKSSLLSNSSRKRKSVDTLINESVQEAIGLVSLMFVSFCDYCYSCFDFIYNALLSHHCKCLSIEDISIIVLQRLLCSELISRLALSLSFSVINLLILAGCSSSVSNINFVINKLLFYFNYYYFPLVNFISRSALIVLMQIQNSNFLLKHFFFNIYSYLNLLILYFL